jgi:ParB-like chromosome segregation protein Spo0J
MDKIIDGLKALGVKLTDLKVTEHNPRIGDVAAIAKSYEKFGQRKPIVARAGTGEIIAGNHQYAAAKSLGWEKIAVVYVTDDDATATAYAVADNKIAQLGEWNVSELVDSLESLPADLLNATGFTNADIEDFSALLQEQEIAQPIPVTQVEEDALKVKQDLSYDEFLERYANRATRAIILYYPMDDFGWMNTHLVKLAKDVNAEDNADAILKLLKEKYPNE